MHEWQRQASAIEAAPLRADAAQTFESKRGNSAGAAIFSGLPGRRSEPLLNVLIAVQVIADFLDDAHERHPTAANGRLYQALVDAVSPDLPLTDYYAKHPWRDDSGYLNALVEASRAACRELPSFSMVQATLGREATRAARAMRLNHTPDPIQRDRALRLWAERNLPQTGDWHWFELTGAASGQMVILALLALAAKPGLREEEVAATYDAYWPTVPLLVAMLDSYVDHERDLASGAHRYISHYGNLEDAVERVTEVIGRATKVVDLPDGHRHAVIVCCMITFYLASESVRGPALRPHTERMIHAGGSLSRVLAPVLRLWRIAYGQRSS
jgi:tetraprenyl-beta-curcumene synthase